MRRRIRIAILSIAALIMTNLVFGVTALAADEQYQSYYELYPDRASNLLGAAQYFSIFARDVTLKADTVGNVAAETFHSTGQAFDIWRNRDENLLTGHDDNYIKNIDLPGQPLPANTGNKFTTRLTLGTSISYTQGNDGRPNVNGQPIDGTTNDRVFVEDDANPFIDFDAEFNKLRGVNQELVAMDDSADITIDGNSYFSDNNNRIIDVSKIDKPSILIHLNAAVLNESTPLNIMGLESVNYGEKTVYIVVDGAGSSSMTSNSEIKLYYKVAAGQDTSGKETKMDAAGDMEVRRSANEIMDFTDSTILWTFTNNGNPMTNIAIHNTWLGTILAPDATLEGPGNIQGSIVVNTFSGSNSTFRWDFQTTTFNVTPVTTLTMNVDKFDGTSGQAITDAATLAPMAFQLNTYATDGSSTPTILNQGDNSWTASSLKAGEYGILEASAPLNYTNDSKEISFTVAEDGSVSYTISYDYVKNNADGTKENRTWTVAAVLKADGTADASYTDTAAGQPASGGATTTENGILQENIKIPAAAQVKDSFTLSGTQLTFHKYDLPVNSPQPLAMPLTGGNGTLIFYLAGGLLIAAVWLLRRKVLSD